MTKAIPIIDPSGSRIATADPISGLTLIRAVPAPDAKVLATAKDGEALSVLGRCGSWLLVRSEQATGYVHCEYITLNY